MLFFDQLGIKACVCLKKDIKNKETTHYCGKKKSHYFKIEFHHEDPLLRLRTNWNVYINTNKQVPKYTHTQIQLARLYTETLPCKVKEIQE